MSMIVTIIGFTAWGLVCYFFGVSVADIGAKRQRKELRKQINILGEHLAAIGIKLDERKRENDRLRDEIEGLDYRMQKASEQMETSTSIDD